MGQRQRAGGDMLAVLHRASVPILGNGVYRLSDVALYTGLNYARVRSWFLTRRDVKKSPIFTADYPKMDGAHVVSFLDMIDTWVAGKLRAEGVRMHVIRSAHSALKKSLGTDHPFAHSSIYTDGSRVLSDAAELVDDSQMIDVVNRQAFFPQMQEMLTHIEYAPDTNLAAKWSISRGVVIDPGVKFGQPVVRGTGVTTHVVARAFRANPGRCWLVAELFGITQKEVGDAVAFEQGHGRRKAA